MAAKDLSLKSVPKQMSDSWIVVDDQDESEFVVIETEDSKHERLPTPKVSPQSKRPLESNNQSNTSQPFENVKTTKHQNKKRKWKVLYSLPSTGLQASINASALDSYVMDQYEQLLDKRDLFSSQKNTVKVK